MTIAKNENGAELTLVFEGRLDTLTSKQLEKELPSLNGKTDVIFDFGGLDYVSSAGLRVILQAQKSMNAAKGTLTLINVCESIVEVFDLTGFSDILTVK